MLPTRQDLQFWEFKKRPKWANLINKLQPVKIDAVINSHSPRNKVDEHFEMQNTLHLIKLHAKNEKCSLLDSVRWLSQCSVGKRLAFVRRLLKKMEG